MLTGKCKTDFEKWLFENQRISYLDSFKDMILEVQHAYLIKWFHSINCIIDLQPVYGYGDNSFAVSNWIANLVCSDLQLALVDLDITGFVSRPEAINAAIEKANEIYNQNN